MTVNGANNETNQRLERLEVGQEELRGAVARLESGQEELRAGYEELRSGQDELRAGQDELRAGFADLRTSHKELRTSHEDLRTSHEDLRTSHEDLRKTVSRLEDNVQALRDDIGPLKADHARRSALRVIYRICEELGLDEVRTLDQRELRAMMRQTEASDIPRNHRYSFIEADAIVQATDAAGDIHYIALEASFTADARDTDRAVRNAGFLTRCTGQPGHAVVVANRIDDRIAPVIASGAARWCHLDDADLQVD